MKFIFIAILMAFMSACSSTMSGGTNLICDPGEKQRCECSTGTEGLQICREDRSDWQDCVCPGADGDSESTEETESTPDGDAELVEEETVCLDGAEYPSLQGSCPEGQLCLVRKSEDKYGCLLADEFEEGLWASPSGNPEYQETEPHCPEGYLQDSFALDEEWIQTKRCLLKCSASEEAECIPGIDFDEYGRDVFHCCDHGLLVPETCPALNSEVDECRENICSENSTLLLKMKDGFCYIDGQCYIAGQYEENICKVCSPATSRFVWTNADAGDVCPYNDNPNAGECDGEGNCVPKY